MSVIDPETLRQIDELSHDPRPLLVLDVDDVVLDFIRPFPRFLEQEGFRLQLDTFRLHGNVFGIDDGKPAEAERISQLIDSFFTAQTEWQTLVEGAAEALQQVAGTVEIVLLTAMPHRHREARRTHLDRLGISYPLLTTEMDKGPAIRRLRGDSSRPVAFVDDQIRNLVSARESVADAHLFHLMSDNSLRRLLPEPPQDVRIVLDWKEAHEQIAVALGI